MLTFNGAWTVVLFGERRESCRWKDLKYEGAEWGIEITAKGGKKEMPAVMSKEELERMEALQVKKKAREKELERKHLRVKRREDKMQGRAVWNEIVEVMGEEYAEGLRDELKSLDVVVEDGEEGGGGVWGGGGMRLVWADGGTYRGKIRKVRGRGANAASVASCLMFLCMRS